MSGYVNISNRDPSKARVGVDSADGPGELSVDYEELFVVKSAGVGEMDDDTRIDEYGSGTAALDDQPVDLRTTL